MVARVGVSRESFCLGGMVINIIRQIDILMSGLE
jgi:hypothetical protein